MAVTIQTTRKAVEISWDTGGGQTEPPEVNVPEFPTHPIVGDPSGPRPDHELPGDQPHPEHPIYLPPYIDNSLPETPPGTWGGAGEPLPTPPIELPPEIADGIEDEEVKQKLVEFLTGNLPPYTGGPEYPAPVNATAAVQVFAQGQDGDWSNTSVMPNDGLAVLSYPKDFSGESYVEVRALDGSLVDSGTIEVK